MTNYLTALFFLFLLIGANTVEACKCKGRPKGVKGVQTCGYYWRSENVFIGLAEKIKIDNQADSIKVTFAVEKTIRGTNEKTVEIFTSANTASCGYSFKQGERYFFYGRKGSDGKYHEGLCGPTVLLKDAEDDLEYVKDIEEGKPGTRIWGNVFEDRQPTVNAVVCLTDVCYGSGKCSNFNTETKTDEFGKFRLKGFETYQYRLDAFGEKRTDQKQTYAKYLIIAKDNVNDEIELILNQSF